MNTFSIKMLAIVTMTIDHIGAYFLKDIIWLRMIGRVSFPLFAWMIANGAVYTRDIKKYLIRVWALAFISQIPYALTNRIDTPRFWELNAVFTLATGLTVIVVWKKTENVLLRIIALVFAVLAANFLKMDYEAAGVLSVLVFFVFRENKGKMLMAQIGLVLMFYILPLVMAVISTAGRSVNLAYILNPLQLLALPIIFAYNGRPGLKAKLLLYAFFPVHYLIMYLVKLGL